MEQINNPQHYGGKDNVYEAIKVIRACGVSFCIGNALKYLCRAGKKQDNSELQDLKKAVWYLNEQIRYLRELKRWIDLSIGDREN